MLIIIVRIETILIMALITNIPIVTISFKTLTFDSKAFLLLGCILYIYYIMCFKKE